MVESLVPIFICAVAPVSIVLIVMMVEMQRNKQIAAVLMKAIEANPGIDADKLAETFRKKERTPLQVLNLRLLRGCIFTIGGTAILLYGIISLCTGSAFNSPSVSLSFVIGMLSLAIGISYLVVWRVTRSQIKKPENHIK